MQSIFCAYTILHQVGEADMFGVVIHLHLYYTEGMQIHRGYDNTEDSAGGRYYRDAKLLTVGVDTHASQRQVITRRLLGTYRL
jgi:alkylation response protein AidB-like acyl-CoA dehydrogenase